MINLTKFSNDTVIQMHSATGKDSIVMIDVLSKKNIKVQPVFMYIVENLEFQQKYIDWAERKYNVKFIQTEHYVVSSYKKYGIYGRKKEDVKKLNLNNIIKRFKKELALTYCFIGFKKVDGLNRRIMLNEYHPNYEKNGNVFPLAQWTNKQCLNYIKQNKLINPISFNPKKPSSEIEFDDFFCLNYIYKNFPFDFQKIIDKFPEVEAIYYYLKQKNE